MLKKFLAVALTGTILAFFSITGPGCAKKPKAPEVEETKKVEQPVAPAKPVGEGEKAGGGFKAITEPAESPKTVPSWVHLEDVYFDFDKSDIKAGERSKLQETARILKENPTFNVTVEGHCDERGTNSYNRALGDRRASSTEGYLASLGVAKSRISTVSYGEEKPVCTEHNEGCWSKNRRAHFLVTIR